MTNTGRKRAKGREKQKEMGKRERIMCERKRTRREQAREIPFCGSQRQRMNEEQQEGRERAGKGEKKEESRENIFFALKDRGKGGHSWTKREDEEGREGEEKQRGSGSGMWRTGRRERRSGCGEREEAKTDKQNSLSSDKNEYKDISRHLKGMVRRSSTNGNCKITCISKQKRSLFWTSGLFLSKTPGRTY